MEQVCRRLYWYSNGFDRFEIYVNSAPADGNCMFHALAYAMFKNYKLELVNGKYVSRYNIVKSLRNSIANKLESVNPDTFKTFYETIGDGMFVSYSEHMEKYSLKSLQELFRSSIPVRLEMFTIMEQVLDHNIFILDENTEDIYVTGIVPRDLPSVVLYYTHDDELDTYDDELNTGHFETISVIGRSGKHTTHFDFKHPFIQLLVQRLQNKIKK